MKLKWGILGAAKIAVEKVIPAMAGSNDFEVYAIASRRLEKAQEASRKLNIPKAYGSYEELISDPEIEVIYIPLPNHMHMEYAIKCIEAGKHVLCEKPLALTVADVQKVMQARDKYGVKVGEAFMVKTHPQWLKTKELVQQGALGKLRLIQGFFSFYNADPENIRNIPEYGGGAVWDIGCYPVTTSRFVLDEEPEKLISLMEFDEEMGTDTIVSVILKFPSAQAIFSASTQMVPAQRMRFFGDKKELEIKIPFNAPRDRPCEIKINAGDVHQEKVEELSFEICDQYRIQAEEFSKAVRGEREVPVPLEDSLANTKVLQAIYQSAREGRWVDIR